MGALVAVINDSIAIVELISEILTEENYRVVARVKGEHPYQMIMREKPDLVVLDIRLTSPDDGHEILELLTLGPSTAAIPIIVCTGDVRYIHDKRDFLAAKGVAVLEKPFDVEALIACVAACLNSKRRKEDRASNGNHH